MTVPLSGKVYFQKFKVNTEIKKVSLKKPLNSAAVDLGCSFELRAHAASHCSDRLEYLNLYSIVQSKVDLTCLS